MASSPFYFQQPFCQLASGCRVVEFEPPADLKLFVATVGYVQIRSPYVRQRVPDGCFSICVGFHETGVTHASIRPTNLNWGHFALQPGWTFVEARLKWSAGPVFLRCPSPVLGPRPVEIEEVLGKDWRNAEERLRDASTARERVELLVELLRYSVPDKSHLRPEIRRAVRLLERRPAGLSVDSLSEEACLSASQLRRVFSREVGASPKDLLRLSRLWWSMRLALEQPKMAWGSIAAECGFSDQAHLVDEYKQFTGSTPVNWYANLFGVNPDGPRRSRGSNSVACAFTPR